MSGGEQLSTARAVFLSLLLTVGLGLAAGAGWSAWRRAPERGPAAAPGTAASVQVSRPAPPPSAPTPPRASGEAPAASLRSASGDEPPQTGIGPEGPSQAVETASTVALARERAPVEEVNGRPPEAPRGRPDEASSPSANAEAGPAAEASRPPPPEAEPAGEESPSVAAARRPGGRPAGGGPPSRSPARGRSGHADSESTDRSPTEIDPAASLDDAEGPPGDEDQQAASDEDEPAAPGEDEPGEDEDPGEDEPDEDEPDEAGPDEDEDEEAADPRPALAGLAFRPPRVFDGELTTLTASLRGEAAAVAEVLILLQGPAGATPLSTRCSSRLGADRLEGTLRVPAGSAAGAWRVATVELLGALGPVEQGPPPSSLAELEVLASEADTSPPEVLSFAVQPDRLPQGGSTVVTVRAIDDHSGPRVAWGRFLSPVSSDAIRFSAVAGADPNQLEALLPVPRDADAGFWTLESLSVKDWSGKTSLLGPADPILAGRTLQVEEVEGDTTKPLLRSLTLDPVRVSVGGLLVLAADVLDEESGVAGVQAGLVAVDDPSTPIELAFAFDEDSELFVASYRVPAGATPGPWRVSWLTLSDQAGNARAYEAETDELLAEAIFSIE